MTESKPTEERRKEIVEAARQLFLARGYEATSTSDIMNAVGIAKGTLYYHFASKEEILDALLDEMTDEMEKAARPFGKGCGLPVPDRMIGVIRALHIGDGRIVDALHLPQNALFHQKSHALTIEKIAPVMLEIVEDGIRQGLFRTDYPMSAVEMALSYSMAGFEYGCIPNAERIRGFLYNMERMLGADEGSLGKLRVLFD